MYTARWSALVFVFILLSASTGPVLGHVSVRPGSVEAGVEHVLFFFRPPLQKEVPMVEFGIEIDEEWLKNGGRLNSFEEITGWDLHTELDEQEKVKRVYWNGEEAVKILYGDRDAKRAAVGETFQMIHVSMNIPEKPGRYAFKFWQKYSDGSVVRWNEPGAQGAKNPYSRVTVKRKPLLTAGIVHTSAVTIALLALAMSLLSFRNNRK